MSHLVLAANTLPQPRLSLILLRKNTSSNQDLHRNFFMKYFYETRLEKNEGGGKVLAAKKKV